MNVFMCFECILECIMNASLMYFESAFQMFEAEQIIKLYKCLAGGRLDIHFKLMNKSPDSRPLQ